MKLTSSMKNFILHWGEMGTRWGVNRTVAQIHALLYLSPEPLTAEEIAETLVVARSNVSTSLRELENWGLVTLLPRMGDRRDFFHTDQDVWVLFETVLEQRIQREVVPTITMLRQCVEEARLEEKSLSPKERSAHRMIAARIGGMQTFLEEIYGWYGQMKSLPSSTVRTLIHFGTGITRFLPSKRRSSNEVGSGRK